MGANTYDPPVFAHKLQGIVFSTLTDYYHLLTDEVRELADAVATADEEKISTARAKVEHNFIQRPVVYDLAVITYEPVSFWKTGKPTSQTILASFEMDEHE